MNTSTEFQVNGSTYRIATKLDAFQQFNLARKLAPVLGSISSDGGENEFFRSAGAALADMASEDCEFIFKTCLGIVQRQQGQAWTAVLAPQQSLRLMFDDIGIGELIRITTEVLKENLGNFFSAAGPLSAPATQAANG